MVNRKRGIGVAVSGVRPDEKYPGRIECACGARGAGIEFTLQDLRPPHKWVMNGEPVTFVLEWHDGQMYARDVVPVTLSEVSTGSRTGADISRNAELLGIPSQEIW